MKYLISFLCLYYRCPFQCYIFEALENTQSNTTPNTPVPCSLSFFLFPTSDTADLGVFFLLRLGYRCTKCLSIRWTLWCVFRTSFTSLCTMTIKRNQIIYSFLYTGLSIFDLSELYFPRNTGVIYTNIDE